MEKLDKFLSLEIEEINQYSFAATDKRCICFVFEDGELAYIGHGNNPDSKFLQIRQRRFVLKNLDEDAEITVSFILLPEIEEYLAILLTQYFIWKFEPRLNKPATDPLDKLMEFEKVIKEIRKFPDLEFLA